MGKTFKDKKKWHIKTSKEKKSKDLDVEESFLEEVPEKQLIAPKNKKKFSRKSNFFKEDFLDYEIQDE